MTTFLRLELGCLVLEALAFVVLYTRSQWSVNPIGRHVMLWVGLGAIDFLGVMLLGTRAQPPLWVYAVVFGAQIILGAWRLILLYRYQHSEQ